MPATTRKVFDALLRVACFLMFCVQISRARYLMFAGGSENGAVGRTLLVDVTSASMPPACLLL